MRIANCNGQKKAMAPENTARSYPASSSRSATALSNHNKTSGRISPPARESSKRTTILRFKTKRITTDYVSKPIEITQTTAN